MRHVLPATAAIALLLLGGCTSRKSKVEAALVKAGVSDRLAACLAPRLADRLSDGQLRTLARATKRTPGDTARLRAPDIVARLAGTGDPGILDVVSKAGLHCALKG